MTEKNKITKTEELPYHLYNLSRFLYENLYSMYYKDISMSLTIFHGTIRCILLMSKEDERNEIYTFDKNNKIQVIISPEIIARKIEESRDYIKEAELHKYKVDLINPAFDIKIGVDSTTNQLYGNFVLVCDDYIKYDRENKSFGSILAGINYKSIKYSEEEPMIEDKIRNILKDNEVLNSVKEKLKKNNYFQYKDEFEFYHQCELLLFSEKHIKKVKLLKEYQVENEENLHRQSIDYNQSPNFSIYDDYDNYCMDEIRELNTNAKSLRLTTSDNYPLSENYKNNFTSNPNYFFMSGNNQEKSFKLTSTEKKSLLRTFEDEFKEFNVRNEHNEHNENIENQMQLSSHQKRDTLLSKINTIEIDELLRSLINKQNTSIELRTNISSEESGKKVEDFQEEILGEEHLFDLNIRTNSSYYNLNDQLIWKDGVNLEENNPAKTAAIDAFLYKFQTSIETLDYKDFDRYEVHRNACMQKGYIRDEMKH